MLIDSIGHTHRQHVNLGLPRFGNVLLDLLQTGTNCVPEMRVLLLHLLPVAGRGTALSSTQLYHGVHAAELR